VRENKQNLFGKEYSEDDKNSNYDRGYGWDSIYSMFSKRCIASQETSENRAKIVQKCS